MCSEPCPVKTDQIEEVVKTSKATVARLILITGDERRDPKCILKASFGY
jgi:cytochrome oxidase Cu insertion factor (SCO1/SenC/PrrC family)